jgi:hypothetical protein
LDHDFLGHLPLHSIGAERLVRKAAKDPEKARRVVVAAAARRVRPDRQEIVSTAEFI